MKKMCKASIDLNIGSDRNAAAVAWDEVTSMLGEEEFLNAIFAYMSTYDIEEMLARICTDYDLDVDEDEDY